MLSGGHRAGWIVRVTQVDQVNFFVRKRGRKIIFRRAGQIDQSRVLAALISVPGISHHYIGIHINRIHWIRDSDRLSHPEDIENISTVALRTIRDENLIRLYIQSTVGVVCDSLPQKVIALLRTVAPKTSSLTQLINSLFHRCSCSKRKRLGHVANPTANETLRLVGFCIRIRIHSPSDLREEVACLELQEIFVDLSHEVNPVTGIRQTRKSRSPLYSF